MLDLEKITLKMTSYACPEQYDAFFNNEQVGYLRLRHGNFTVEYPDCGDKLIYEAEPNGDGVFDDDERVFYLNIAKEKIMQELTTKLPTMKKIIGLFFRLITFPFLFCAFFIAALYMVLKQSVLFIRYGGEFDLYEEDEKLKIRDCYELLKSIESQEHKNTEW